MKPSLLFSSEIWAHESKEESSEVEKLFSKFCKHLLAVHKNTTNLVIHGELGTYLLHIDVRIKMMLYYIYLKYQNNKILSGTLTELQNINSDKGSAWIKKIKKLITENNLDIASYKYCAKNYMNCYLDNISQIMDLRSILSLCTTDDMEVLLQNSGARLKIEIGRYGRIYNDDAKRYEQLPREKRTCDTCNNKVEDELHFLLECPLNEEIRHNFLQKNDNITTEDFRSWSDTDKIKYLLK